MKENMYYKIQRGTGWKTEEGLTGIMNTTRDLERLIAEIVVEDESNGGVRQYFNRKLLSTL